MPRIVLWHVLTPRNQRVYRPLSRLTCKNRDIYRFVWKKHVPWPLDVDEVMYRGYRQTFGGYENLLYTNTFGFLKRFGIECWSFENFKFPCAILCLCWYSKNLSETLSGIAVRRYTVNLVTAGEELVEQSRVHDACILHMNYILQWNAAG